jgi:hypothetical protein
MSTDFGTTPNGKKRHRLIVTIQYDDLAPREQRIFASGAVLVALNECIQAAISLGKSGDVGMPESAYSGKCNRCGGEGCTWCNGSGKSVFFQEGEVVP